MRLPSIASIPLTLMLLLAPASVMAAGQGDCIICHNSAMGKVMKDGGEVVVKIDIEQFQASVHGPLSCTDCHESYAGSPHAAPASNVDAEVAKISDKVKSKANSDAVAIAACNKCHPDAYEKVLGSVHGKNIVDKGKTDGPLCIDCHGSPHYIASVKSDLSPVHAKNVPDTCGHCHGNVELAKKYDMNANVMKTYHESFHGKKHTLGHEKAPTCASCHGSHEVMHSDDASSPVAGINKIKTCDKCHPGANEKFIGAISHKEVGPIPHYAEKGLILLCLSVFAFIIGHVLLEAYADIRDTFFRKPAATIKEVESGKSE